MTQIDKNAFISDNIVFDEALNKFKKISDEEIESSHQLKKSKQAIIAGRLLRIRSEIKQLDQQLK
jgi:hypothetical protein